MSVFLWNDHSRIPLAFLWQLRVTIPHYDSACISVQFCAGLKSESVKGHEDCRVHEIKAQRLLQSPMLPYRALSFDWRSSAVSVQATAELQSHCLRWHLIQLSSHRLSHGHLLGGHRLRTNCAGLLAGE